VESGQRHDEALKTGKFEKAELVRVLPFLVDLGQAWLSQDAFKAMPHL
jgi:hypothetical protein